MAENRKLTKKQKNFAVEYITNGGNGTEAAIAAGYSKNAARNTACQNLKKPHIMRYIQDRMKSVEEKRTMELEEALEILSSVGRGETQKSTSKIFNNITGEEEKNAVYEYSPSIEERLKALEHIVRCHGGFVDKIEAEVDTELKIEIDYGE